MIIYMAHPLDEREYVAKEIIPQIEALGIDVINPFASRLKEFEGLTKQEIYDMRIKQYGDDWFKVEGKKVVDRDLKLVEEADVLVAYIPYASFGTIQELMFASLKNDYKSIILTNDKHKKHIWLNYNQTTHTSVDDVLKELTVYKELIDSPLIGVYRLFADFVLKNKGLKDLFK